MDKPQFMPVPPGTSLAGKTILVTGGNSGLGLEFARQALTLAASHVIITVRSEAKGNAAIATLRADPQVQASDAKAKLQYFILDLDDYDSGLELVRKVQTEVPELDILLCNAGTNSFQYETSKSGHERLMQVHCYTHFLMVLSLLPLLRKTAAKRGSPARVNFLSSYSHAGHTLDANPIATDESVIAYFDDSTRYVGGKRYMDAKLVINAFVQRLAIMVPATEIIVNCVCPGVVATDINRNLPIWIKPILYIFFKIKARPVTDGARVLIRAAVVVGEESHGKYLQTGELHSGAAFLSQPAGEQFIEKLWVEILADSRKINPELAVSS